MENQPPQDRIPESTQSAALALNNVNVVDLWRDARNYVDNSLKTVSGAAEAMLGAFALADKPGQEKGGPGKNLARDNQWTVDSTDKKTGTDTLKMTAVQSVSLEQFKRDNPGVDPEKLDKDKTYNFSTYQSKLDPGWSVTGTNKDGSLRLSKEMKLQVNHKDDHSGLVETVKDVSDEHKKEVEDKLKQIPESVRNLLERNGYKVLIAPSIVEGLPDLKGQAYRGWKAGFDYSDGTQDGERRLIVAPEKVRADSGDKWEKVSRPEVLTHQFGHALDAVGKQVNGTYFSESKDFLEAYTRDVARLSDKDAKSDIGKYLTQPNGGGQRETFASIFGLVTTGPENPGDRKELERMFPITIKYMNELKDKLR